MFKRLWVQVGRWHHEHRLLNHPVDKSDCYHEFLELCKLEAAAWKVVRQKAPLLESTERWVQLLEDRVHHIEKSRKYRESYTNRLCASFGGVERQPSRYTSFTPEQEKLRFRLTLQGFDRAQ